MRSLKEDNRGGILGYFISCLYREKTTLLTRSLCNASAIVLSTDELLLSHVDAAPSALHVRFWTVHVLVRIH